ncbi:hypothetical protein ABTD94_21540, partial [Acinetobacter baumannii]
FDTRIKNARQFLPKERTTIDQLQARYTKLIEDSREAQALAVENTPESNTRATQIVDKTLGPAFDALRADVTREVDEQIDALKVTSDGLT